MAKTLAAAMLLVTTGHQGEAWRGSRWGMTEAQVLRAVRGTVRAAEPGVYSKGVVGTVELRDTGVTGIPMPATFAFRRGHLVMVNLYSGIQPLDVTRVCYDDLRSALVERYGLAVSFRKTGLGPETTWKTASAVVRLSLHEIGEHGALLLHYGPLSEVPDRGL